MFYAFYLCLGDLEKLDQEEAELAENIPEDEDDEESDGESDEDMEEEEEVKEESIAGRSSQVGSHVRRDETTFVTPPQREYKDTSISSIATSMSSQPSNKEGL